MNSPHPIDLCSVEESERIWREIAQSRGMTLEEFDRRVGAIPPTPLSTVKNSVRANGHGRHVDIANA